MPKNLTIAVIRRSLEMTQQELADAVEVAQPQISYFENGLTIPNEMAIKIVEVLKTRSSESFTLDFLTPAMLSKPWQDVIEEMNRDVVSPETTELVASTVEWDSTDI